MPRNRSCRPSPLTSKNTANARGHIVPHAPRRPDVGEVPDRRLEPQLVVPGGALDVVALVTAAGAVGVGKTVPVDVREGAVVPVDDDAVLAVHARPGTQGNARVGTVAVVVEQSTAPLVEAHPDVFQAVGVVVHSCRRPGLGTDVDAGLLGRGPREWALPAAGCTPANNRLAAIEEREISAAILLFTQSSFQTRAVTRAP